MMRTLYSRLALTLFVLLCVVGIILVQVLSRSSTLYQQEVAQKLNRDLAMYIVEEHPLFIQRDVNAPALDNLFHQMMVINPSIEVYLLDAAGTIISFNAPEGSVKRTHVDLQAVKKYLSGSARFPLRGDDPRSLDGGKVFSAAVVPATDGSVQGYLYVVLGGEQYENLAARIGESYSLDTALTVLLIALAVALGGGLLAFAVLTRRLRKLCDVMLGYSNDDADARRLRYDGTSNDEIDMLGHQFNTMADKITHQLHELKCMDNVRREMVANISHDLRTPLTTMRGYLETLVLQHGQLDESERLQYVQTALTHSQRLGRMIEELFELARLDSCESVVYAEPFSMCELVQDVCQTFALRAQEKSITLDVKINPDTPAVYGDISMMQRVMENLLENGLRHTPTGGTITVAVDVDSGKVMVRVADTGCGIPEADVPRIFERFYQQQKHRSDSNTAGLGLAIVRRILELHGSVIQVKSELEKGTTFTFNVPVRAG